MDIWMIWATAGDLHWLVSAWDDDSVAGNSFGWDSEVAQAHKDYGAGNVRIMKTAVDFDSVVAAFAPAEIANDGTKEEK